MYSVLRYVVFSTQFFILLRLFDVHITYFDAFVLITSMFLIISIIPSIAITELGKGINCNSFIWFSFIQ